MEPSLARETSAATAPAASSTEGSPCGLTSLRRGPRKKTGTAFWGAINGDGQWMATHHQPMASGETKGETKSFW